MNIVVSGNTSRVYGEEVKTYKQLPALCYDINFNKMTGFFLTSRPNLENTEQKIYGNANQKTDKILKSFNSSNRNLGVIFSGKKRVW